MQYAESVTMCGGCAWKLAVSASPIKKLPAGMYAMPLGHVPVPASPGDTQVPPLHAWPLVHATPHTPQLDVVLSVMHAPPQTLVPLGHD